MDVLETWMISILSSILLMATILIILLSTYIPTAQACFWIRIYLKGTSEVITASLFQQGRKASYV